MQAVKGSRGLTKFCLWRVCPQGLDAGVDDPTPEGRTDIDTVYGDMGDNTPDAVQAAEDRNPISETEVGLLSVLGCCCCLCSTAYQEGGRRTWAVAY